MFDVLTVYHGGTEIIENPKVDYGRTNLDFGPGFYMTDLSLQAKDWARIMGEERDKDPIINIYHLRQKDLLSTCKYKIFNSYDEEWLDFITQCRLGKFPWKKYDYIEGGIADDRVINTVRLYMTGYISAKEALTRLKFFKPNNQICILNQQICDRYLKFIGYEDIKK